MEYRRTAKTGYCDCGKKTCMVAILRDNVYPYVHLIFKCARCIKADKKSQ